MKTNHKLKIDYKGCHEGLWNWLADNPDKDKEDWPGWKTIKKLFYNKIESDCFACDFAGWNRERNCHKCPVNFGVPKTPYHCENNSGSYYEQWRKWIGDRSANARKIAQGWTK